MPSQTNKPIKIATNSLSSHGEGVGMHEGIVVFVEGALPEETVLAEVTHLKKRYAKGRCLEVLTPSPYRTKAPCPIFEQCGGCQVMHCDYAQQLAAKRQRVADALKRIGHIDIEVQPCKPSPEPLHYRNKVELTVDHRQAIIGFHAKRSDNIVDVKQCYIHDLDGEKVYHAIRKLTLESLHKLRPLKKIRIRSAKTTGKVMVCFITSRSCKKVLENIAETLCNQCPQVESIVEITPFESTCLRGTPNITEQIHGITFKVSPTSFFQVNTLQAEHLYATALAYAEIDNASTLLDAYCGVGTLSLLASRSAKKVIGIESHQKAVDDAKDNAAMNGIENCEFLCGLTEKLIDQTPNTDAVILNPPRSGCAKEVLESLAKRRPRTVVYVSCDPATLARDLSMLTASGYSIEEVQPIDMFPQTMHVETVVKLTARLD